MKEHFCLAEQSIITYQGKCNWCGESEGSMTQEALKLALEALETPWNAPYVDGCDLALGKRVKAIAAIKEALAHTQEPVAKNEEGRITWLMDDWPQNCFLYAEPPKWTPVEIGVDVTNDGSHVVGMYVLPDAVRYVFYSEFHSAPQRTWVGLTDEDCKGMGAGDKLVAMWADRTLKEKNT